MKYFKNKHILKNKKDILKVIVLILLLIGVTSSYLAYRSFLKKNNKLSEVKLRGNVENLDMFAIMIEQEDGTYKESDSSKWPTDYAYNQEKSGCLDADGNEIEEALKFDGSEVTLTTRKKSYCYLYFDIKADIKVKVSTDGKTGTIPTTGGYANAVNCTNGTGEWDNKYKRLKIGDLTNDQVLCNLTYTKDTSSHTTLKSKVELTGSHYTYSGPDYINAATLTQSEYGTPSMFSSTSNSSTSGTTVTNAFTFSGSQWSSVPANLTSGTYYHFMVTAPSTGYYQLCYTLSSGYSSNYLNVYKNTTQLKIGASTYLYASTTETKSGCVDIGELTTSDYVKVVQRAYSNTTYPIATLSFYLKKTTSTTTYDAGYRYIGKQPNNYVWFNNEMWRIIGSIPTCTSYGCSSKENLVKIIRSDSIGDIVYDYHTGSGYAEWGRNSLYSLLNNYYYGRRNGTDSGYCYGYSTTTKANCDYTGIGIDGTSYYGKMVKNVYWNTGAADYQTAVNAVHRSETATISSVSGRIGLMSASDYGYAASSSYHSTNISSYGTTAITGTNWLYGMGDERLGTVDLSSGYSGLYVSSGSVYGGTGGETHRGYAVRPVVYLDSSVYIISGDGTQANPYIIGM